MAQGLAPRQNQKTGKVHRVGAYWQADDGAKTASQGYCGANVVGMPEVAVESVHQADKCRTCWGLTKKVTVKDRA